MLHHRLTGSATGKLIREHLRRIFPRMDEEGIESVVRGYWTKHQKNLVALFHTRRLVRDDMPRVVQWRNRHLLEDALDKGRGVLLLVPHYGDERTLHILLAMHGYPIHAVSSRYLDQPAFVRKAKLRVASQWHHVAFPDQSPRWMYRTLGRGEIIHIAPTAYGGPKGTWVESFGLPILTSSTPYRLYDRTGCSLLVAFNTQLTRMRYEIELQPVQPPTDAEHLNRLTAKITERKARELPQQYEWLHLVIRHRETNTIRRLGYVPGSERVLEEASVPEDGSPSNTATLEQVLQALGRSRD
jgi:KDO2-lipid IV(A) lauroyltransferase